MTPVEGRIPIAEYHVIWVLPSGERQPGRIAICAPEPSPYPDVENDTTWACWWFLEGLWHRSQPALGDGSLQPLIAALEMIGHELHAFIARGGRVLMPDHSGWAGALMMLRVLLRRPGDLPTADPVLAEIDAEIAETPRGDEEH
jgi:hypothetical protein